MGTIINRVGDIGKDIFLVNEQPIKKCGFPSWQNTSKISLFDCIYNSLQNLSFFKRINKIKTVNVNEIIHIIESFETLPEMFLLVLK